MSTNESSVKDFFKIDDDQINCLLETIDFSGKIRNHSEKVCQFKEESFGNFEIPYIRYYLKGELITATNFLPKGTFSALLTRTKLFKVGG